MGNPGQLGIEKVGQQRECVGGVPTFGHPGEGPVSGRAMSNTTTAHQRNANKRGVVRHPKPTRQTTLHASHSTCSTWINEPGSWRGPLALVGAIPATTW